MASRAPIAAATTAAAVDPKRYTRRLSQSLGDCHSQVQVYGECLLAKRDTLGKGACQEEFAKLSACIRSSVCDLLAA